MKHWELKQGAKNKKGLVARATLDMYRGSETCGIPALKDALNEYRACPKVESI